MTPGTHLPQPHDTGTTTVFFDDACPLCRSEIAYYRRRDAAGRLVLVDLSAPGPALPDGLDLCDARGAVSRA